MQPSDVLWFFLFDSGSIHSSIISTKKHWLYSPVCVLCPVCVDFPLTNTMVQYSVTSSFDIEPDWALLYFSAICPRMKQFYFLITSLFSYIGEAHSLKVEKILYKGKSPYQEVLVFEVHIIY